MRFLFVAACVPLSVIYWTRGDIGIIKEMDKVELTKEDAILFKHLLELCQQEFGGYLTEDEERLLDKIAKAYPDIDLSYIERE